MANETFTAIQNTVLAIDNDLDGVIDPGDVVTTAIEITNNSTTAVAATGVQFNEILDGMTIIDQPGDDINVSPIAFDDTYNVVGNTTFAVNAANGILQGPTATHSTLSADAEFFTNTIGANAATQTHIVTTGVIDTPGGSVTLNADGSFTYTPDAGFTGTDSFTYTLTDAGLDGNFATAGDNLTGTGTVTFNVEDTVWFIDNTAPGSLNLGTQDNPFTSIAAFNAVNDGVGNHPAAGDIIYLRAGTYTEADGINLLNNQTLVGQGENLVVNHSLGGNITVETGSAGQTPVIIVTDAGNQGIQLAQGNTISGLDVGMNNATAVAISDGGGTVGNLTISNVGVGVGSNLGQAIDIDQGGTLAVTIDTLSSTGSSNQGVDLQGVGGSFTSGANGGTTSISGASAAAFNLQNSDANVTVSGSLTSSTLLVAINNHDAGTVTFDTGNITATAAVAPSISIQNSNGGTINFNNPTISLTTGGASGVQLLNNSGGTINFNPTSGGNGFDITTTTGAGFNATGGGTLTVTGTGNTITSNAGQAVNMDGMTIGGSGVNFASITSTNSTSFGVSLTNLTGGAVDLGGGSISGADTAGFRVGNGGVNSGGTATISYAGSITSTDGQAVSIEDRAAGAGNVNLSGSINHSSATDIGIFADDNAAGTINFTGANILIDTDAGGAAGVTLTDNTGATINFNAAGNGLDISTASGAGFTATGGGTVNVTGSGNSVTSTNATALNIANTTIGATSRSRAFHPAITTRVRIQSAASSSTPPARAVTSR
jgi:Cadherin-like domain